MGRCWRSTSSQGSVLPVKASATSPEFDDVPTLHGFEEPPTRMLQTLFHLLVSSPNCLAKTTCRYQTLRIFGDKFYQ